MSDSAPGKASVLPRIILVAVVVAVFAGIYVRWGDTLTLAGLAEKETQLRELQQQYQLQFLATAFLVYVVVTGLSIPGGATALTLVLAWFFGFWQAIVLVSFASTAGATIAFLLSRYLFRDYVQRRFATQLEAINRSLESEGPFYLFTLRLIPTIPFFVINLAMGLTPMKARTFWWVSQLGMLPGTAVYVYAGSQVSDLKTLAEQGTSGILTLPVISAFVLLGVFPLIVKKIIGRLKQDRTQSTAA